MLRYKLHFYETHYSPDDGGYYAEIINGSGRTVHTTRLKDSTLEAIKAAKRWINRRERPYRRQEEVVGGLIYQMYNSGANLEREIKEQQALERQLLEELRQ